MDLARRVATRFILADSIGEPAELLRDFRDRVEDFAKEEPKAKKLLDMYEQIQAAYKHDDLSKAYALEGQWLTTDYSSVADVAIATERVFRRTKGIAEPLFLALLQQFTLPAALTKKVQAAARFWSKRDVRFTRVKGPGEKLRRLPGVLAYPKLLKEFQAHVQVAELALRQGKPHSESGANKLNAGPFTVINTGAFDEGVMQKAVKTIELASRQMHSIGLGKVCYGDVLVSNTLTSRSNIMAFYLVQKDEMFVRANVSPDSNTVRFVCHELAHRLEHKFLSSKKGEIKTLYRHIADAHDEATMVSAEDWPDRGKTIEFEGRPLTVTKIDPYRQSVTFKDPVKSREELARKGISEDEPGYDRVLNSVAWTTPIQTWLQKYEGKPPPPKPKFHWVTEYAKKDPSENFAEMVSFWAIGQLDPAMIELLEAILK